MLCGNSEKTSIIHYYVNKIVKLSKEIESDYHCDFKGCVYATNLQR